MITTANGAAWLEALASRYEDSARLLREAAARVRECETLSLQQQGDGVGISEAVRQALGAAGRALRPREIVRAIVDGEVQLQTKSHDISNIVQNTLYSLERTNQVRRKDGGWVLA